MAKNSKNASNTAGKQPKAKRTMPKGVPFKKNDPKTGKKDSRINRKGRPRDFDELRKEVRRISHEQLIDPANKRKYTRLELMIIKMMSQGQGTDHKTVMEYGYGKVPDQTVISGEIIMTTKKKVGIDINKV